MINRLTAGMLLALLLAAGACSSETDPGTVEVEDSRARIARLRDAVAEVAALQAAADDTLSDVVTAVRDLDGTVARMRVADTIDDALEAWPPVSERWPEEGGTPIRAAMVELAMHVDDARVALVAVRARRTDAWERSYLDAQDDVLSAVRAYAESADRLAQVVEQHWDDLVAVRGLVDSFAERRWFFRSDEEATQAFEVEVQDLLLGLDRAIRNIGAVATDREAAAAAVNSATDVARDLWTMRPAPSPAPG